MVPVALILFALIFGVFGGGILLFLWTLSDGGPVDKTAQRISDPHLRNAFMGAVVTLIAFAGGVLSRGSYWGKIAAGLGGLTIMYTVANIISWLRA